MFPSWTQSLGIEQLIRYIFILRSFKGAIDDCGSFTEGEGHVPIGLNLASASEFRAFHFATVTSHGSKT